MTLKDLIIKAGGLDANIYRYKVEGLELIRMIIWMNIEIINFNMNEKFSIKSSFSSKSIDKSLRRIWFFLLKPYDLISIRPDLYFNDQSRVRISGEVLYPGDYVIYHLKKKLLIL